MVWRTNFDQQINQLSHEARQGKIETPSSQLGKHSSSSSSSSIGSNNGGVTVPRTNDGIHAANMLLSSQRDQQSSPLTIPLNESMTLHGNDDVINGRELDPTTAAIMKVTQPPSRLNNGAGGAGAGNNRLGMMNGKKALPAYTNLPNGTSNSILKKATTSSTAVSSLPNEPNFASISYMFEQLVGQMEILSQVNESLYFCNREIKFEYLICFI